MELNLLLVLPRHPRQQLQLQQMLQQVMHILLLLENYQLYLLMVQAVD